MNWDWGGREVEFVTKEDDEVVMRGEWQWNNNRKVGVVIKFNGVSIFLIDLGKCQYNFSKN